MSPEFVIVGQGLAGTALAWALLRRGRNVLVLDREGDSSSRVAAGLITPVTGKRLARSWRWDELYPAAVAFYRAIETQTGTTFFHQHPALRLFADEAERDEFHRRESTVLRGLVRAAEVPEWFAAPFGGFEMPHAARLDVPRYLDVSREHFRARGMYVSTEVAPSALTSPLEGEVAGTVRGSGGWGVSTFEVEESADTRSEQPSRLLESPSPPTRLARSERGDLPLKGGGQASRVRLCSLGAEGQTVILCRGFTPDADPWFGGIRFNAAKGEMLTVRVPGLRETRTVHRGVWLSPLGDELFRVGATYTWEPLDSRPTPEGRAEIEAKLRAFLTLPFTVTDHRAAVRPVIDAGYPVLGRHPLYPHLAYFNGLGSKGSLLAPFFANQLAAHLCGEARDRTRGERRAVRGTQTARERVTSAIPLTFPRPRSAPNVNFAPRIPGRVRRGNRRRRFVVQAVRRRYRHAESRPHRVRSSAAAAQRGRPSRPTRT